MNVDMPIVLPWYDSEADYAAVLAMLPASERQDPFTYDVFIGKMKRQHEAFKRQVLISICVPVKAVAVKAWCDANNRPFCRKSITEFISTIAATNIRDGLRDN
jgi:hypothetical protein